MSRSHLEARLLGSQGLSLARIMTTPPAQAAQPTTSQAQSGSPPVKLPERSYIVAQDDDNVTDNTSSALAEGTETVTVSLGNLSSLNTTANTYVAGTRLQRFDQNP